MFAERLFLVLGRAASRLPHVRGKTRLLLWLFKLLGLRHVRVQAQLRRPVKYVAELDLHAWLQRVAFLTGGYEAETVEFLAKRYAGGYLLDIGANVGLIAIPFALSTGAEVIAVEAVPDNVEVLRKNVELNDLSGRVRVIPFGLGDASRTVEIQVEGDLKAGEGSGTANILPAGSTHPCVRQRIEIRTLDELVDSGIVPAGCSLVKIDTDGYDLKVLQGGTRFIARERPVVFGEFSAHCMRWHGQSLADVVAFADAHGYETRKRVPGTWRFEVTRGEGPFYDDLLLVPRD